MATAFFRDQGLRDLAYCGGGPLWQFSSNRKRGFIDAGEAAGLSVSDWVPPPALLEHWSESGLIESLAGWIAGLPRPCGVLCPSDEVAHYALTAARAARRRVPEDLAVLGVDNDEVLCELSSPALASIDQGAEKIGYAAAELLDRLMRGEAVPESPVVVPPTRVVSRRSAELLAVDDPAVSGALAFIRERFGEPIQVQDVADHVAVSRSSLQRRFRERMDRTVHQELVRVRMERAKLLLLETDQTLPQIAAACGLNYGSHLSLLFRRVTGQSPSTFRAQRR
jgi:LacI family transcriptional regulator